MAVSQIPPALLVRATGSRLHGRVHFLKEAVGQIHHGADEDYEVFRKLVLDPTEEQPAQAGAVLTVRFQFASFSAAVNKRLSLIVAPFIAAQPGFRSKTWMMGRESGVFQGVYEWDSVADAEAYRDSFPMRMLGKRAASGTLSYEIVPSREEA